MPRKRKGPKREASEGGDAPQQPPPPPAHSAVTGTSTEASAPVMIRNSSADSTTTPLAATATATTNKRMRLLAEAEEDRLGKLVGLERWIESVGHGRGAAVCIGGHLLQTNDSTEAFIVELSCVQPNDPSYHSNLSVTFNGELARKVSEPLLLIHRLGPPAIVYLSGFAAEAYPASSASLPRAIFNQEKAVLKMSPQPPSTDPTAPTSAIWIEQLATPPAFAPTTTATAQLARTVSAPAAHHAVASTSAAPSRPAAVPQPQPEPSPPSQLSDWFSTPAPTDRQAAEPNSIASASSSSLPAHPQPIESFTNNAVKSEPHAVSSSSTPSPRPGRAVSRQPSAAAASAPPPPQRRNAPNVKPRRMGNCLYTPMSMLRDGERASIIGVVIAAGDPRRSSSGTRDLSIKITIADASCLSGTGYAKELARSITVMLFAQQTERIPQNLAPGHIVAVRSVQIQMFSNKPQAVGKSAANWSWATYDPVSGDVRASSNFPLASHTPPECSADEMDHFRDMANWFSELQGVDANIATRSSRPTLKLQEVGENIFFDTVVEVLKVYTHTLAPDLYVTDYTNHTLFYRGNDKYLRLESDIPYPDETDGWGHVFQISLWDSHATIAEGLQTGDIIRIQNVRPKLNPRGLLTGGLGSSTDNGIKIRTLKPTDEARIDLEKRRARFMETLMAAEEDAFADRVEREHERASQQAQGPNHQAHQPEQGSDTVQDATAAAPSSVAEANSVDTRTTPVASDPVAAAQMSTSTTGFSGPSVRARTLVEASPVSSTQPPFPTPAQRQLRAAQEASPSKTGPGLSAPLGTSSHANSNSARDGLSFVETPDLKPNGLMGPPGVAVEERRPLIKCNAPASIPLTALADLPTTSLCPGMFKVKACIISTNPAKVEQWGRAECKACKRLVPLDQRFCIKCGDEEGESLSYCFRFAIMLEEVDAEFVARKQQHRILSGGVGSASETTLKKTTIPLLFHGRMAEVLLPCVDAKALYNGERSSIKTLKRFHNRLLHPNEYGKDPEQVLAVYSYPSQESGRTVRRFAALKELNCLYNPLDLL
ncbi:uncharacterized protein SPSC_05814 [Sporisorium scitamineum]|uniref:Protection of telomeres protein 1 n=1 Tax=Sporisorium scitamineum TaxID=49012 RepID=A0A0F7S0S5_9BASI|nr:uncharacterized protein SPSC_05814 [Sporisorium scitamineum]CDW95855.1 hypothetical protein [Sporisorium scitamineum]